MRRTYRKLNDCEMQHNAEVGLFTRPSTLVPTELIASKIYLMRSVKVMLDRDLAELYGVETKVLKKSGLRVLNSGILLAIYDKAPITWPSLVKITIYLDIIQHIVL